MSVQASLIRWSMNQAVVWVTFRSRWILIDDTPLRLVVSM